MWGSSLAGHSKENAQMAVEDCRRLQNYFHFLTDSMVTSDAVVACDPE